ncbi:hypothetical protein A2187_01880 [Candidatus Collierbacteria bacterium RIFOXYA1_FULL_46_24]|uniref:Bacterial Ig-like domain-containing protein n=1 Tax=Candidatus Collierbacteria bacterium RIFOXYD1_FULL_46_26 TaxID=1817732 RepID=A0A1F5G047_9BACT|nr:MAG: hypothetical protein UX32_C0018G0002 [Microgenomates group bacterium GW2011_GWF1_46_12]OGD70486.1 MAG: hypothetical protein A2187_01880 [Candidatus Collierbacteria bacterium RIFOXYA1_FULL_46_24]OGD85184.1 MAG: hypothetical protein A2618_00520 [Candidatus Collierbacteria bacterium RIFOXYD1_FULL_46_26]
MAHYLVSLAALLSSIVCYLISAPAALAGTDPISHTATTSATVLATTPTTGDTTAPTIPILIAPPDGSSTGDTTPEFMWRQCSDPNGNTVIYTLYLNGVATYLGISHNGSGVTNDYTSRVESEIIRLIPSHYLLDGSYDWYVTASDLSGNTSRSASFHLVIDSQPPFILVTDIANYHDLTLDSRLPNSPPEGTNFDVTGPTDVYFTIHSEPSSTISINGTIFPVPASGIAYPYLHFSPGIYTIQISASDATGNTTTLPGFTLTVSSGPSASGPLAPILPPSLAPPGFPPSFPATIYRITTTGTLAYLLIGLLALAIGILLFILWRRRYNLILLDLSHHPIPSSVIYHSHPPRSSNIYRLTSNDHGQLYLPHLARSSTLTIRLDNNQICTTHILSLNRSAQRYTLYL